MGCDIHMFAEFRREGGKWEVDSELEPEEDLDEDGNVESTYYPSDVNIGRNYKIFGFLADVRSRGSCIYEPRGMPDDPSEYVDKACKQWGVDGHSHHYLSLDELKHVIEEYRMSEVEEARQEKQDTKEAKNAYQGVIDYLEAGIKKRLHKCPEGLFDVKVEARVVFWFDN